MRSRLAFFLLSVFLFANTELHEVLKLGAFVGHYFEHQRETPQLSLLEFIHIHYSQGIVFDEDYSRDMQLPFKTADCISLSMPCLLPAAAAEAPAPPVILERSQMNPCRPSLYCHALPADIWQPPRH